jgi:hypothetical protein
MRSGFNQERELCCSISGDFTRSPRLLPKPQQRVLGGYFDAIGLGCVVYSGIGFSFIVDRERRVGQGFQVTGAGFNFEQVDFFNRQANPCATVERGQAGHADHQRNGFESHQVFA